MDAHFQISPRILDHLGVAAYTSLKKCLAELCSNCYDADAENVWIDLPENFTVGSEIIIRDDGIGMRPEDLKNTYLFIGYDRRVNGDATRGKNRPVIGNKGIGKLAGFGIANLVRIVTVQNGVESSLEMDKTIFDDFSTLTECSLNIESVETNSPNGTTLILSNLSSRLKPVEPLQLRQAFVQGTSERSRYDDKGQQYSLLSRGCAWTKDTYSPHL